MFRRRAPFAVLVCVTLAAIPANAGDTCDTSFQPPPGAVGNLSWHVAEYWDHGVPGPDDIACVLEPGMYQVLVTEPVTIEGLVFDVPSGNDVGLRVVDTDFTVGGLASVAGSSKLKVNDDAVLTTDNGGTLEVYSKLAVEGGTVEIPVDLWGNLSWWGEGSITGEFTTYPGCVIEVEDQMTAAHLTIGNGFINNCDMELNDLVEQSLTVQSGSLVNSKAGVISTRALNGGQIVPELHAQIENNGLFEVDGLDLLLSAPGAQHVNQAVGVIEITGGELTIDLGGVLDVPSNFTNYGTTTVATGGSIRVNGSAGVLDVPSNFTNYGTTTVASGGSIRVNGSAGVGDNASLLVVNYGLYEIHQGGGLYIVDAAFQNPPDGEVAGSGLFDISAADGVFFDGILSPGLSPGILDVAGSIALQPNARLPIEIGGETPGTELDRLDVSGSFGAGGTLDVSLIAPYHPFGGERFQIATFDQLSGWFSDVVLPPLSNLLGWQIDATTSDIGLQVVCQGTQIGMDLVADRDPVSVGYEVVYLARVTNLSSVAATDLVVLDTLAPELTFRPDLSSPECTLVGTTVECARDTLDPSAVWQLAIAVEPVVTGPVGNTSIVDAWECDTFVGDNQATALVDVVAAAPCDANYDLAVTGDDLDPAVGHIFGVDAPGNPDCRLAGGITADDLAAIIDASFE
jgi:uncharacterized repeat protein (TIGR01451 family)